MARAHSRRGACNLVGQLEPWESVVLRARDRRGDRERSSSARARRSPQGAVLFPPARRLSSRHALREAEAQLKLAELRLTAALRSFPGTTSWPPPRWIEATATLREPARAVDLRPHRARSDDDPRSASTACWGSGSYRRAIASPIDTDLVTIDACRSSSGSPSRSPEPIVEMAKQDTPLTVAVSPFPGGDLPRPGLLRLAVARPEEPAAPPEGGRAESGPAPPRGALRQPCTSRRRAPRTFCSPLNRAVVFDPDGTLRLPYR